MNTNNLIKKSSVYIYNKYFFLEWKDGECYRHFLVEWYFTDCSYFLKDRIYEPL